MTQNPKLRVAAYCRVSTDKDDQANSFVSQQRYFAEYIRHHPGWELQQIYADEGISGTGTRKRPQFNRMMADARQGRFDRLLTKEVSRFSRNLLDAIRYTRELKALGIGVVFLTDGIDSLAPDAELRLSIMASIAQEESRKTSQRVKWGQTRRMEQGVVFGHSLLGYTVREGQIYIEPQGADVVRSIFHKYAVEGKGAARIARELQEAGYRTGTGRAEWTPQGIVRILKNEKYVGDLRQKKSYTPDFLTHAKKTNRGAEEMVCIRDHHAGIVSRDLWAQAQALLAARNKHKADRPAAAGQHLLSGKVFCDLCGSVFTRRKKEEGVYRWRCARAHREGGQVITQPDGQQKGCDVGCLLREDAAMAMLCESINSLSFDREAVLDRVWNAILEAIRTETGRDADRLLQEIDRLEQMGARLLDSYIAGEIDREAFLRAKARYDSRMVSGREELAHAEATSCSPEKAAELRQSLQAILTGEIHCDAFYRPLLERITVCKDKHKELRLRHLPQVFRFEVAK